MSKTVMVGLSGGVDSCVAALLLREQGYRVIGAHLLLTPDSEHGQSVDSARAVAEALGITLRVYDLRAVFRQTVTDYFIGEYLRGATPNPCTVCNREIKFGALFDLAKDEGADYVATGHYAKIAQEDGLWRLKRSASPKDQSYFLYLLKRERLPYILFPLGDMNKDAIRARAARHALPVASRPDSQEICFVPGDDYAAFIAASGAPLPPQGDFIDLQGNILGRHNGIVYYTVGQRKGLGSFGMPMYVCAINADDNTVTLGPQGAQYGQGLIAGNMNWLIEELPGTHFEAEVKIRYRAQPVRASVDVREDGTVRMDFAEPRSAVTPGQAAVLYDGDTVLGGGRIKGAV